MQRVVRRLCFGLLLIAVSAGSVFAQKALTWQEVRDKFEASNPTLRAGQIGIDESRAQEVTANLRPNPNLTILADQIDRRSRGLSTRSGGPTTEPTQPDSSIRSSLSISCRKKNGVQFFIKTKNA